MADVKIISFPVPPRHRTNYTYFGLELVHPVRETGDRKGSKANAGFSLSGGGCQDATVSGFAARTKSTEIIY